MLGKTDSKDSKDTNASNKASTSFPTSRFNCTSSRFFNLPLIAVVTESYTSPVDRLA